MSAVHTAGLGLALSERARVRLGWRSASALCRAAAAQHASKHHVEALRLWRKAAARGSGEACYRIGLLYQRGEGVAPSAPEAAAWHRRGAELGCVDAQFQLGRMYLTGSEARPDGSQFWLEAVSGHESEVAKDAIKTLFPHGVAVARDDNEAVLWMTAASEGGRAESLAALGDLRRYGRGGPQDLREARRLYLAASRRGVASGLFNLGDLY
jgi:uncharacterized protein